MNQDQKNAVHRLIKCRDNIRDVLHEIEFILKNEFPEEHDMAYQHWIPQIMTALYKDNKWLPRSDYNMQLTLDRILDQLSDNNFRSTQKIL